MRKKITHILWAITGLFILGTLLFFTAIWNGWIGYMPDIEDLENPIDNSASQIFYADGSIMGSYSEDHHNRVPVSYDEIAPCVFKALVATEDKRFYEHSGVDLRSLLRALIKRGLFRQQAAGGGSTITQQLAKQLYSSYSSNSATRLMQKANEWMIAIKLEHTYSKDEILTLYLNYFDFLHQAVGISNAAKIYFNKKASELEVPEAAMLIGMCKNPSLYNPLRVPDRVRERRNVVIDLMAEEGYISDVEANAYKQTELGLNYKPYNRTEGSCTYFREYIGRIMMAEEPDRSDFSSQMEYEDARNEWKNNDLYGWCYKNSRSDGESYNIKTDGLRIYTSIDPTMQRYAEKAVREHLKTLQAEFNKEKQGSANFPYASAISASKRNSLLETAMKQSLRYKRMKENGASDEEIRVAFNTKVPMTLMKYSGEDWETEMTPMDSIKHYKSFLQSGFMAMDPSSGYVKAYVGGIDYSHFQYDMVSLAHRQVGSTIKPYLYALAIYNDMKPEDKMLNVQKDYNGWMPRNGSKARYGENVPLSWALANSNNWISAALIAKFGPQQLVWMLNQFGINHKYDPTMPLCLGSCEISLNEMVCAYTTFANAGQRVSPIYVTRIEDSNGKVLARFTPQTSQVISNNMAYDMVTMMKGVVDNGTGRRLRNYIPNAEVAAKTGTSQNNSDGWFMAVVPKLVAGCWVGGESPDIHFNSTAMGQGASMALPIYGLFMRQVYANSSLGISPNDRFVSPTPSPSTSGSGNSNSNSYNSLPDSGDVYDPAQYAEPASTDNEF